uniref:secreted Ly-6/uPAR domain-containing protein 2 isoform X1 n=1 Tax=Myodes glareolus TaxID=447135 RepID=UPI00201FC755|nr:secreted Ly-6/uPAR domain-containing protein 2 isoform X1 [Myodes glareolus]
MRAGKLGYRAVGLVGDGSRVLGTRAGVTLCKSCSLAAPVSVCLIAITQGMQCHICKGFGGCSHPSRCPRSSTHCVIIGTRAPISFTDLPLVTKMCYNGCPDVASLGLGPHVSIVCCQSNLCNKD